MEQNFKVVLSYAISMRKYLFSLYPQYSAISVLPLFAVQLRTCVLVHRLCVELSYSCRMPVRTRARSTMVCCTAFQLVLPSSVLLHDTEYRTDHMVAPVRTACRCIYHQMGHARIIKCDACMLQD